MAQPGRSAPELLPVTEAASGVDGVTYQEYERNLEANLEDLEVELARYRAHLEEAREAGHLSQGSVELRAYQARRFVDFLVRGTVEPKTGWQGSWAS